MTTLAMHIALPEPIERFTRAFVRRHRRLALLRSVFGIATFCVTWGAGWALADRFFQLSPTLRAAVLAVNAAVLLIGGSIAAHRWRKPGIVWQEAAAAIERCDPALADQLQTVVTQAVMPTSVRGSDGLIAALVAGVNGHLAGHDPSTLLPSRSLLPAGMTIAAVLLISFSLVGVEYLDLPRLFARQFRPFAGIAPVTTTRIVVQPGALDVAQGSNVIVTARAERLGDDVLTLWTGESPEHLGPQVMPRATGETFVVPLKGIEQDTYYRVAGGDAETPVYAIRVLRKPAVRELRVRYEYPNYLQRPPLLQNNTDGKLEAPRGTRAEINIVATEPLKAADVLIDRERVATYPTIDPYVRTAWVEFEKTQPWALEMVSDRKVIGNGYDDMRLTAIEDRPPIVQLMREDIRLHPSDVLALPYQAIDDFGIESLSLDVRAAGKTLYAAPLAIRSDKRMVRDVITLDLAPYALSFGDVVTVTLSALDGAGQERMSTPCRVLIAPRSVEPRALQRIAALREAFELSRDLVAAPDGAAPLLKELLRVISQTESSAAADHAAQLIDAAQRLVSQRAWVFNDRPLEGQEREIAERLKEDLARFWKGEQAKAVLAELENIRAGEQQQADASRPEAEALKLSVRRAREEWSAAVKELELDPNAGNAQQRLEELARDLDRRVSDRGPVDFVGIVRDWGNHPPGESHTPRDRLAVAAQAEVLRGDGELSWARDLQLVARAMVRLDEDHDPLKKGDDPRRQLDHALARLREAKQDVKNPDVTIERRRDLEAEAEAAREQLRRWAGERSAETTVAQADEGKALAATPADVESSVRPPEDDAASDPDAPEIWKPRPVPDRAASKARTAEAAERLADVTRRQQKLNDRTRSFNAEQQARQLAGDQEKVAEAIGEVRQQDDEGFFEPSVQARQETLEAIRSSQQALAGLPQRIAEMRQQAESVQELKKMVAQAETVVAAAGPAGKSAAERAAAEAQRQLVEARQRLTDASSPVFGSVMSALRSAANRASAVPSASDAGKGAGPPRQSATGLVPFGPTFNDNLSPALKNLQQTLSAGDPAAARVSAGKALDAIAELQASLRIAQRRVVQRDPLVAAKFYAGQAALALQQRPPDLKKASAYQRETSQALSKAWDSALNRGLRQRLDGMPAFRSLLNDDFTGSDPETTAAAEETAAPGSREWGRLINQTSADIAAAVRDAEPAGFEEALKVYFQTLDKARSSQGKQ